MPSSHYIDATTLTVLTVNTHKGFTSFNRRFMLHELREALRLASPDIVFLQEVLGEHQGHAERHQAWPALSQYEFLADSLWTDFAYGRNAVYPAGHHGNALLSRYPIERHENHDVTVHGHEGRGLLHCVLRVPSLPSPVHAICVHLGLLEGHRGKQLRRLCELVTDGVPADEPLLIAGDFNDWRLRADALMTGCGTREVFTTRLGRPARTFPARWPLLRLDRIYVRNVRDWQPVPLASRVWSRLSDHVPICAEIAL
ncbi:endonuclease/exonuclease/phosphatase family protein 1 [Achromobacter xylosoxidans A8]|uniref:Endonuclease/exonuclease/phosphatase family protein 1 n=1 Tax=Achromobacter xylosoxidans (strain A8) TaxID=762376 RepID=E3HFU6_ACHXA|nr:endonuclease/exonuclease/phosphatase family protein [Achromobacter xylosoxidans]ADP16552.1 endonuclease/exonuclease/phosphatase family protein 1 [Achromobacter xylosoxidans A8]